MVKIVRELDRYGGAFAAEWARPEAQRLDAPIDGACGEARICGAEPALQDFEAAAPCNVNLALACDDRRRKARPKPLRSAPPPPPFGWSPSPALTRGGGKGGDASPPPWTECGMGEGDRPHRASKDARLSTGYEDGGGGRAATGLGSYDRPENLAQRLEKVESAPGTASAAMARAGAGPSIANIAAHGSRPRAATNCLARPPQGQGFPAAASSGDARPENPPQRVEKVESAPGIEPAAMAGADVGLSIANAAAGEGLQKRRIASPPSPGGRALRPPPRPPRRATLARKIRGNALKRLNPRPGRTASGGGSSPARRSRDGSGPNPSGRGSAAMAC